MVRLGGGRLPSGPGGRPMSGVPEYACPGCGGVFPAVWQVTVGESDRYEPVFGGPVALDLGRCEHCNISYEQRGRGLWRQRAADRR